MKLISLSIRLRRAGYRAQRGTWWLMWAALLGCCGLFLYHLLEPAVTNRHSIYSTLTCMNTDVTLYGGGHTSQSLAPALKVLENSPAVDYYILESRLEEPLEQVITSVSTVVTTRQSLFAVQPDELLCDSENGEPLDGYVYVNARYPFEGIFTSSIGDRLSMGDLQLEYKIHIWGDDYFDMLVSNRDFAAYGRPIRRIVYGISPFASRNSVDELNLQLQEVLPRSRFQVTMDRSMQIDRWALFRGMGSYRIELVAACLIAYFLMFRYLLDRRLQDLTVARLVGCRRLQLVAALTFEAGISALTAYLLDMGIFTLYRMLFAKELPRIMLLLWIDSLPVLLVMTAFSCLLGLAAAWRWVNRTPVAMEREAMA